MAGYIGSKSSVTLVDGYSEAEADAEFVNDPNDVITVSGSNVGIGTSSPEGKLHVYSDNVGTPSADADDFIIEKTGDTGLSILSTSTGRIYFGDVASNDQGSIRYVHGDNSMRFETDSAERMRIDSSGNVGIGTSSSYPLTVQSGTSGSNHALALRNSSNNFSRLGFLQTDSATAAYTSIDGDGRASGYLKFNTNDTERMRIDSSGNLLVGKTSSSLATDGIEAKANGSLFVTRSSAAPVSLRRSTTDGEIIAFYKDGTTVGSIDASGANLIVQGSISAGKTGIKFGGSQWIPQDNGNSDGGVDLGMLSVRFDDVFATNGTIQTSDFNEKQDIASLTATEMLVGKRISALFKTFRWKDSVAEKGDNARTHTGVIAQDVQAAFTAEGLDAGDYALFISSTWWEHDVEVPAVEAVEAVTETTTDEDGNEVVTVITEAVEAVEAVDAYTRTDTYDTEDEAPEGATSKTRMGIRYPELLSFVAAYNEQRFASIEARLTALEA
jgi:hypothetical protein